jgi:hypothetical protein
LKDGAGNEVLVAPKVSKYETRGRFLIGERTETSPPQTSYASEKVPVGHFFINLETMEVKGGLTREELEKLTAQ